MDIELRRTEAEVGIGIPRVGIKSKKFYAENMNIRLDVTRKREYVYVIID